MSAHARIAPSALALTVPCPGSLKLQESYPSQETDHTREGTAAHHVALHWQQGEALPVGHVCPNGVTVDADMRAGAAMWARTVGPGGYVEQAVRIPRVHAECWGTPDFFRHDAGAELLTVAEYKYGYRYVDVWRNPQLLAYAAGIIDGLELSDIGLTVLFIVVQPRSYHRAGPVRTWKVPAVSLRPHINRINHAAHVAVGGEPYTATGDHCIDCRARHVCERLKAVTASLIDYAGSPDTVQLPPDALSRELALVQTAIERLEARESGLAEQAFALLRAGQRLPLHRAEQTTGRLGWTIPPAEVAALGDVLDVQLRKPLDVLTPTQAKALIPEPLVDANARRKPGTLKLVRDDLTESERIFSNE